MARARYKVGERFFRHRRDAEEYSKRGTLDHVRSYFNTVTRQWVYAGNPKYHGDQGAVMVRRVKREVTLDGKLLRGAKGGRYLREWRKA